jgi:site-specific DNA recombinase
MKSYLIARVSTEDQKDALPAQVYRLLDYAKRRSLHYELIEFQESAYKGSREQFNSIITKIKSQEEFVLVVFDKIDRYTRDSSSEEVRTLRKLYEAGKIELHFISDNLVIHKDSPASDIMRLGLGALLGQYYSDAVSDNVKRKQEQKLRDGEWIGKAPIGYKNTEREDGKKWVEIDAWKADAVRTAFQLYASGNYSLRTIKQKLQTSHSLKLSIGQLDVILKNPFYMGEMLVKGKTHPHKYDVVIPADLFEQTRAVREGYHIKPKRWGGLPYAYRGLIACADCSCRITFEKKKGMYVYGHCTQYKGKHGAAYVAEEDLTRQLMRMFESIAIPEHAYNEVSQALRQSHEDKKEMHQQHLSRIDAEIEKYQKRIERNYDAYLDGDISKETYKEKANELSKAHKSLVNKRVNIELVNDDYYSAVEHLLNISRKAPEFFRKSNNEQKRSLINLVLSNLELKDKELRCELKKPYDTIAFCNENGNWLARKDSNLRFPVPETGALPLGHSPIKII